MQRRGCGAAGPLGSSADKANRSAGCRQCESGLGLWASARRLRSLFFGFWEVAPPKLRLVQDDLAASRVLASGGKCLAWGILSVVSFGKVARKGRRPLWACCWPVAVSPEALSARLHSQDRVVNLQLFAQMRMNPLGAKLRAVESVYGRGGGG